jgi:predicted metal-dependent hydrolase
VSNKGKRIAAMAEQFRDGKLDPHYSGYFKLFNEQKFYEAHDVLEHIWLKDKYGVNGSFYKGLIQLAGAFVHLQKNRLKPSGALFKLARTNFEKYPFQHEHLNMKEVLGLINKWFCDLESMDFEVNPLLSNPMPKIFLSP